MHSGGLDDDTTILDEFADICTAVRIAYFILFRRVKPDLASAYASDRGCEPLLGAQVDHLSS